MNSQDNKTKINAVIEPSMLPPFLKIAPFFLSTLLFNSAFFIFLTPFPLLMMKLLPKVKNYWYYLAFLSNLLLMALLTRDPLSLASFFLVSSISFFIPLFLIQMKLKPDVSILFTFLCTLFLSFLMILFFSLLKHKTPLLLLDEQIMKSSEQATEIFKSLGNKEIPDAVELKKSVYEQGFFMVVAFFVLTIWGNMLLIFRSPALRLFHSLNLEPSYFRKWKVTDHFIWVLIGSAAGVVFLKGILGVVFVNILKITLLPYALQGLAIIAFFMNLWKIEGIFRVITFLVIISFVSPLIIGLGVFDLWFDFRAKFGQIKET